MHLSIELGPIMMLPWLRFFPVIKDKFEDSKQAPLLMRKLQDKLVAEHEEKLVIKCKDSLYVHRYIFRA